MTSSHPEEPTGPHYSTLPRDTEARLAPGTVVADGRIEIIEELGRGGMAIVYRARDLQRAGAAVAFKVVTAQEHEVDTEARYRNEARLAASLATDPQFVRPLGVGCLDGPVGFEGRMFLITELVSGIPLDRVMLDHRRGMPIERACSLALDVARALVSLHERGIVHRDIKPGNILVDDEGTDCERVRLIDFGLAYATGDGWEAKSQDLTQEGHAPGTPIYMSPQQIVHERPTIAFDIYAFGVLFYELISGHPPQEDVALQVLISRKCDPQYRPFPIEKMRQYTPSHVASLVGRCLAYDPAERPTAMDVVEVLQRGEDQGREAQPRPELRLVPHLPSVVAPGARPAGDTTRADLERKAVPLPFVKRAAEARAPEIENPQGWADADEARVVPKSAIAEIAHLPEAAPVESVLAAPTRRWWWLAAPLVFLAAIGFLVTRFVASDDADPAEAPRQPKTDVTPAAAEREAGRAAASHEARSPEGAQGPGAEAAPPPADAAPRPLATKMPRPAAPRAGGRPKGRAPVEMDAPKEPKADAPSCDERRALASEARATKKWSSVLTHTKDASCWPDAREKRTRLRVEALLHQGRYMACAKEGASSTDATVAGWRRECYRRAAGDTPQGTSETP